MPRKEMIDRTIPLGSLYLRDLPLWLRDKFHASCVNRGVTMRSVMVKFMKEFVGDNSPPVSINMGYKPKRKKKK